MIKFKVSDVDTEVDNEIGVHPKSCEGPLLFPFIIQPIYTQDDRLVITLAHVLHKRRCQGPAHG